MLKMSFPLSSTQTEGFILPLTPQCTHTHTHMQASTSLLTPALVHMRLRYNSIWWASTLLGCLLLLPVSFWLCFFSEAPRARRKCNCSLRAKPDLEHTVKGLSFEIRHAGFRPHLCSEAVGTCFTSLSLNSPHLYNGESAGPTASSRDELKQQRVNKGLSSMADTGSAPWAISDHGQRKEA